MGLHVVLEYQAGEGPGGVVLGGHLGEDVDEIVVEVWILIELLQLGLDFSLGGGVWAL